VEKPDGGKYIHMKRGGKGDREGICVDKKKDMGRGGIGINGIGEGSRDKREGTGMAREQRYGEGREQE
jgi:hypothetical protein